MGGENTYYDPRAPPRVQIGGSTESCGGLNVANQHVVRASRSHYFRMHFYLNRTSTRSIVEDQVTVCLWRE
jgi:hypothetical protein